jgi:DNA-binding CsgD family transcriptional regulator
MQQAAAARLVRTFGKSWTIGVAIINRRIRIDTANLAFAAMVRMPVGEHTGKHISDVLGKNAGREIQKLVKRVLSAGKPLLAIEQWVQLPNRKGGVRWIGDFVPIVDRNGKTVGVFTLVVEAPAIPPASKDTGVAGQIPDEISARGESDAEITRPTSRPLSAREQEVLGLLAIGRSTNEIAAEMQVTNKTVESHRANIGRKLGTKSAPDLLLYGIRESYRSDKT